MSANYPMKCRYDREGHGDFANGIALRQHYDAVHPEYVAPAPRASVQAGVVVPWSATPEGQRQAEPVQCDACGVSMRRGSFAKHKKTSSRGRGTEPLCGPCCFGGSYSPTGGSEPVQRAHSARSGSF